jgi:lambda repressor-like predicted transcriptional regulator
MCHAQNNDTEGRAMKPLSHISSKKANSARQYLLAPLSGNDSKRWFISKSRISNLQKLAKARTSDPKFDWEKFGYCCGCILRQFDPDKKYNLAAKGERAMWRSWAATTPETVLTRGKYRLEVSLENVPNRVLRAVEAGLKRSIGFKGVMGAELAAKIMGVTYEIRQSLDLRMIGAIDVPKAARLALAAERHRKRNTKLKARIRKNAGSIPHSESIAAQARAMGVKPNTLRRRLQRQAKKESQLIEKSINVVAVPFVPFSGIHKNRFIYSNMSSDKNGTFVVPISFKRLSNEEIFKGGID